MAKQRVSLSLDSKLVRELDRRAGGRESRSAMVQEALRKYIGSEITLVLLCGGPARGLFVPELKAYRPLLRLAGGKTLVENALERFRSAGARKAIVVGSREVNSAVFAEIGSGEGAGMKIDYVEEKKHAGSMHTLSLALERLDSTFAFAACDHYFDFDVASLLDFHTRRANGVSLALYAGTAFEWNRTSVVELNGELVAAYYEKPAKPTSHVVATMLGFAEPEAFSGLAREGSLDAAFAALARKKMLYGFLARGNFVNVHSRGDLEIAGKISEGG